MNRLSKIGLAALGVAVVALAALPADAACLGSSALIQHEGVPDQLGQMFTNPAWYAACGVSNADSSVNGWYPQDCTPAQPGTGEPGPVGPNAQFFFWAAGQGIPGAGSGRDNGTHPVNEPRGVDQAYTNGFYYWGQQINSEWGNNQVDGCDVEGGSGCTCFMAVDEINNVGTLSLHTMLPESDSSYRLPNPTVSKAIPAPTVNGSARVGDNVALTITEGDFTVASPQAFSFDGGSCAPCATLRYLLYQTSGPRPGTEGGPTTRSVGAGDSGTGSPWTLIPGQPANGTPLGVTIGDGDNNPPGFDAPLLVDCGPDGTQRNAWVAARILVYSGYQTFVVGGDSTRVECGPNVNDGDINDPQLQPRPRPRPDTTPQKPGRRTSSSR
jgi:hypothetical protein